MNLSTYIKTDYAGALVTNANNTNDNSSRFDMAGYDGIIFLTTITDSATGGVATLTVEASTTDADTYMAAITSASAAKTCASGDDINGTLLIVDVYRPLKRYVQGVRTSSVANIAFGEIIAIRYRGKTMPVDAGSTVSTQTTVVGS